MTPRARMALAVLAGLCLAAAQAPLSFWPALPAGFALMCLSVQAAFWGAAFWGALRLGRPWLVLVLFPLAELARAYVFTGFPWGLTGYGWLGTPLAQLSAWIGPHGLGAVTLMLCSLPVFWSGRRGTLAGVGGLTLLAVAGFADRDRGALDHADTAPVIRLTQPNAPQHLKWDRAHIPKFFQRQIGFTGAPATDGLPAPDLIVWPETSVPAWLNDAGPALERMSRAAGGTPMVVGIQRYEGRAAFNTAAVLDGTGAVRQVYDKHHLVPFGEYLPFAALFSRLGLSILVESASGFEPGPGPVLIDLPGIGTALPLICYEAVFPQLARAPGPRPDFLLHLTNDAWFGTWAGPQQHLAQARFRAIEQGLPLLRSANTGITAVIDAYGDIHGRIALGTAGYLDARLPPARAATLYSRTGDWSVLAALVLTLCATVGLARRNRD